MKLVYLTANMAWTFIMGDQIIQIRDNTRFFSTREAAVDAANRATLGVDKHGDVYAIREIPEHQSNGHVIRAHTRRDYRVARGA